MANELTGAYLSPGALGAAQSALSARDDLDYSNQIHWWDSLRLSAASRHAKNGIPPEQWCPVCEGTGVVKEGPDCLSCAGTGLVQVWVVYLG